MAGRTLEFREDGATIIPEGYLWCAGCGLLAPHHSDGCCLLCGNKNYDLNCCHEGGWSEDQNSPLAETIIIHHEGCHFQKVESGKEERETFSCTAEEVLMAFQEDIARDLRRRFPKNFETFSCYQYLAFTPAAQAISSWVLRLRLASKIECGCPRVVVFPATNIHSYQEWSEPSQDFSSALVWYCDVWREVCGMWFSVKDPNF